MKRLFKLKMVVVEVIDTNEAILQREQVICKADKDIVFTDKSLHQIIYPEQECALRLGSAAHDMKEALAVTMGEYLRQTKEN